MGRFMSPPLGPLAIVLLEFSVDNVALVLLLVMVIGLAFAVTFAAALSTLAGLAFDEVVSGLMVGGGLEGIDLSQVCCFPLPESVRHVSLTLPLEVHAGLLLHKCGGWVIFRLRCCLRLAVFT